MLVASSNVEICVISRSLFMDNYVFSEGNQSEYTGLNVRFSFWLNVALRINFSMQGKRSFRLKLRNISQGTRLQNRQIHRIKDFVAIGFSPLKVLSSKSTSYEGLRFMTFIKSTTVVIN